MSKVEEAYKEIENILGSDYITDKDFMKAAYSRNVDPAFPDRWADIIVRPETTEEVSDIVKIANKYNIPWFQEAVALISLEGQPLKGEFL